MQVESKRLTNCSLIFILRLLINNVFPLITTSGANVEALKGRRLLQGSSWKRGRRLFQKKEELFI